MASKDFEVLNIQNDDQEINLQFHDSSKDAAGFGTTGDEQTVYFSNFPNSAIDDEHGEMLVEDEEGTASATSSNFLTFEYYQQFFNVDTKQVGERIMWSMVPKPGINYLQSHIRPTPDLYGPFWIAVTLILTTAVTGNIANYFQSTDANHWKYDFHKVTLCTSFIFSYAIIVPVCIWGLLLWRKSQLQISLLEITCLYGYSLAVFVPVSVLWLFPIPWLQWCLGIVASVMSGCVLVRTITPSLSHEGKRVATAVGIVIILLHAALALSFMLYFFYPPSIPVKQPADITHKNVSDAHAAIDAIKVGEIEKNNQLDLKNPDDVSSITKRNEKDIGKIEKIESAKSEKKIDGDADKVDEKKKMSEKDKTDDGIDDKENLMKTIDKSIEESPKKTAEKKAESVDGKRAIAEALSSKKKTGGNTPENILHKDSSEKVENLKDSSKKVENLKDSTKKVENLMDSSKIKKSNIPPMALNPKTNKSESASKTVEEENEIKLESRKDGVKKIESTIDKSMIKDMLTSETRVDSMTI